MSRASLIHGNIAKEHLEEVKASDKQVGGNHYGVEDLDKCIHYIELLKEIHKLKEEGVLAK